MSRRTVTTLPDRAEALQGQPAGLISRSLAAVVDVGVVVAEAAVGYLALSAALFVWNPRRFSFPEVGWFTWVAVGTIAWVYLTLCWWIAGRSCGCAVWGLRVLGGDGGELRLARTAIRAAVCVLFPLGLVWSVLDRRGRAVHDLVTGSQVVYDWRHHDLSDGTLPTSDVEPADRHG
jgi:uncharacterized RDD family membrane protein YckC